MGSPELRPLLILDLSSSFADSKGTRDGYTSSGLTGTCLRPPKLLHLHEATGSIGRPLLYTAKASTITRRFSTNSRNCPGHPQRSILSSTTPIPTDNVGRIEATCRVRRKARADEAQTAPRRRDSSGGYCQNSFRHNREQKSHTRPWIRRTAERKATGTNERDNLPPGRAHSRTGCKPRPFRRQFTGPRHLEELLNWSGVTIYTQSLPVPDYTSLPA